MVGVAEATENVRIESEDLGGKRSCQGYGFVRVVAVVGMAWVAEATGDINIDVVAVEVGGILNAIGVSR